MGIGVQEDIILQPDLRRAMLVDLPQLQCPRHELLQATDMKLAMPTDSL